MEELAPEQWQSPPPPLPPHVQAQRDAVCCVTDVCGNPDSGSSGGYFKFRGYPVVLTSLLQVPTPAVARQSLANFYGAHGHPARSLPLLPERLFEPFAEYNLVLVAVDARSLEESDEELRAVRPLRPCLRLDELKLNETWIEREFDVVCHAMGGPKSVEIARLRAVDSCTIWYIDPIKEGCHGAPVFVHDLWVGVSVQPGFKEVPRRAIRIDELLRQARQFTDVASTSGAMEQRSANHPDLTPIAVGTFVSTNRSTDHLGRAIPRAEQNPTHFGARSAVRKAIEVRQRKRRLREKRQIRAVEAEAEAAAAAAAAGEEAGK